MSEIFAFLAAMGGFYVIMSILTLPIFVGWLIYLGVRGCRWLISDYRAWDAEDKALQDAWRAGAGARQAEGEAKREAERARNDAREKARDAEVKADARAAWLAEREAERAKAKRHAERDAARDEARREADEAFEKAREEARMVLYREGKEAFEKAIKEAEMARKEALRASIRGEWGKRDSER